MHHNRNLEAQLKTIFSGVVNKWRPKDERKHAKEKLFTISIGNDLLGIVAVGSGTIEGL